MDPFRNPFVLARFTCGPSVFDPTSRIDGDRNFPCLLVSCLYGRDSNLSLGCPVASLSMFSPLTETAFVSFPVCGCKITTVFALVQMFLCFSACFSEILFAIHCDLTESTNVKIYFKILMALTITLFCLFYDRFFHEKSSE